MKITSFGGQMPKPHLKIIGVPQRQIGGRIKNRLGGQSLESGSLRWEAIVGILVSFAEHIN